MITRLFLLIALIQPDIVFSVNFDASQCEISKGCHLPDPKDSVGMGVAWNLLDDETMELELFLSTKTDDKNGRYVAVGFSDDAKMGNEPVIECSAIGSEPPSMKFSFDKPVGKGNQRIEGDYSAHFSNTTASFQDGELYCKGLVKVTGSSDEPKVFKYDPTVDYHLLLVNGKTTAKGLGYHSAQSSVSRKIRLAENSGFDDSQCGKSKGCTMPQADSCYSVDGGIGASYRPIEGTDNIEFEIFGPANTSATQNVYVALGFSNNEKMNNISVIECSQLPGEATPTMKFSFNPAFFNARIDGEPAIRAKFIQQSIGKVSDGSVYCKGVVNVGGTDENWQIFKWNKNQGYHLMFAAGFTGPNGLTEHWGSCVSILTFLDQLDNIGFNDAQCGTKKGCFQPTDCKDDDACSDIGASWEVLSPNKIHVELTGTVGTRNAYVAMGFSTNSLMGNTSVIECSSFNDSEFSMTFSYNYVTEHYQNLRPTTDVSNLFENRRVQFVDGVLYCSADVMVEGNANDQTVFKYDPETKYSMILATGATKPDGLAYHHTKRSVAPAQLLSDYTMPTAAPAPTPSGTASFDSSSCGQTKGCYAPNSNDAVSYRVISDSSIEFELSSTQPSSSGVYIALGFSPNGNMGPASVIECSSLGNGELSMKFSTNSANSNERITGEEAIRQQYITNTQTSYSNGKIYCKGTVKSDGNANSQIFKYNPDEKYYLIVAKGSTTAGGLGYHGPTNRFVSSQRALTDYNAGNGSGSKVTLVILHAIFMTVAWMTMVPTAVIFARVLRSSWPTLKPGGLLIWFHIHRGANLIGIALMIAGFVLILIHKDWKFVTAGWGGKHAIIGIIALCLAWLQPFISTLRCSPNDPRRPIFNYIHRGIGVIAMILATTAICIAGYHFTPQRNVPQLVLALIPISVIFALSLFFIIFNNVVDVDTKSFTKPQNGNSSSSRTEDIPMRPTSKTETETTWTIRSPQSQQSTTEQDSDRREVPAEKKRLWVNRFREFVVYGVVLIFVAIGTILSVFFALGLSS